jgi:ubiquinone/menaquinone biosynthesis C-methylase UbiE
MTSLTAFEDVDRVLAHISRVLKQGGTYMSVSRGTPGCRMTLFQRPMFNWTVDHLPVPQSLVTYCFMATKRTYLNEWFFGTKTAQEQALRAMTSYQGR